MLTIESHAHSPKATSTRLIHLTPDNLRQAADRLEHLARGSVPGESVLCELTRTITVVYRPDIRIGAHQIEFTPDEVV